MKSALKKLLSVVFSGIAPQRKKPVGAEIGEIAAAAVTAAAAVGGLTAAFRRK